jgi:hypothetical protein
VAVLARAVALFYLLAVTVWSADRGANNIESNLSQSRFSCSSDDALKTAQATNPYR